MNTSLVARFNDLVPLRLFHIWPIDSLFVQVYNCCQLFSLSDSQLFRCLLLNKLAGYSCQGLIFSLAEGFVLTNFSLAYFRVMLPTAMFFDLDSASC